MHRDVNQAWFSAKFVREVGAWEGPSGDGDLGFVQSDLSRSSDAKSSCLSRQLMPLVLVVPLALALRVSS